MAPKSKDMSEGGHQFSAVRFKGDKRNTKSMGKTGVELRYYTKQEYRILNKVQKKELAEWRAKEKSETQKVAALEQQLREMREQTKSLRATIASITFRARVESRQSLTNPLAQRD